MITGEEMKSAPVLLEQAGAVADGDQFVQSTPSADVALLDSLPKEQQELAVTMMLDQGKQWLVRALEATNPAREVSDFKAFVATVAEASKQKKLSEGIQLDAVEMVRRAERALGVAIRKGQEAGEIATARTAGRMSAAVRAGNERSLDEISLPSSRDFIPNAQEKSDTYAMSDGVTDQEFDEVLTEAKGEGNLSRANVVRKVKNLPTFSEAQAEKWERIADLANQGYTSHQIAREVGMTRDGVAAGAKKYNIVFPADQIVGKTKRIDPTDVLERIVASLEADVSALELVRFEDIAPDHASELLERLAEPMRALNRMKKQLKEISGE